MLAVYAIVNGNGNGWLSAETLGLLGAAAALFVAFVVIESRVAEPLDAARDPQAPEHLGVERGRRALGGGDVRVCSSCPRSTCSSCSATARSRSGSRSCPANVIMGVFSLGLSAKLVMRFGIKPPLVAGLGARRRRRSLLFARAPVDGTFATRRPPADDPARLRRRDGVQPGAARRDGRREAGGLRARLRAS